MTIDTGERDRLARELYDRYHPCPQCGGLVSLADQLGGACPHCAALIMAGPITPDRAAAMLTELQRRRGEIGLKNYRVRNTGGLFGGAQ